MELTKQDTQMAKGTAVLGMVMLHLFCRMDSLPYMPLLWYGDVPLIYYLGLFGDICVPVFCFCSGYAHYLMAKKHGKQYPHRLPGKALRFLCNFWIVVLLFSGLGLVFDESGRIPGSFWNFLGNMLVVGMNYNGAWWFVVTYLILLILSPSFAAITRHTNGIVLLFLSIILYFVSYIFRFVSPVQMDNVVLNWMWQQIVLLGTSQLGYFIGMVSCKYKLASKLRMAVSDKPILRCIIVLCLPALAFGGHCIVQSVFVAPFTAVAVLMALFSAKQPKWKEKLFLFLGEHSTNIWLVHMFFYLELFPSLVFSLKYPPLILLFMLALCVAASIVIGALYRHLLTWLNQQTVFWGG